MKRIDNRVFYRNVISIAMPIALQSLIGSSLSLIDNLMVGSLGEVELAAVGAGIQVFFLHWMLLFGFNGGAAAFNAQFWGAGSLENIRKVVGFVLKVSLALGFVFFTVTNLFPEQIMKVFSEDERVIELGSQYMRIGSPCFLLLSVTQPFVVALRATQQPKLPLAISVTALIANTCLNYILIFGKLGLPRLETEGAALATVLARLIEMSLILFVVFGKKNILSGRFSEFVRGDRSLSLAIVRKSLPTTANEFLWGLGQTMYMSAIGHISVTAYAAAQASHTIENMFVLAGFSLGDAALILLGAKLGEDRVDEVKLEAKKFTRLAFAVGLVAGLLLILCARPLTGLFDFTDEGRMYAVRILIVYGIIMCVNLYNGTMVTGVLRGGGDTVFAAVSEVGTVWLIGVPLGFLGALVWELPVYIVVALICTEQLVKAVILTCRARSGKWANNIVKNI